MASFIPDGYLDRSGAIEAVIQARFPDERAAIDDMHQKAHEMGRLLNLSNRERQLAEKAEPVLRSLLFKGSLPAIIFDQHGQDQLPAHFWATEDADDVLLHGSHRLFFHQEDLRSALDGSAIADRNKGGAPAKADWPAIEEAFMREVKLRGLPDDTNVDGWQRQADVVRWIADMVQRDGDDVGDTTLKIRAREFLKRARAET